MSTRWRLVGDALVRDVMMRDFDEAFRLLERIAAAAEDHFRRPDMCISEFNRVSITISNPHHAGITDAERRLAAKVDAAMGDVE
jgi:pterin-4a-carbinolamine dehydratase